MSSSAQDEIESPGSLTHRTLDDDVHGLARSFHQLSERVLVMETRMNISDGRLLSIETEVRGTKTKVSNVLGCLQTHIQTEENQKNQLLMWIITTLLSVLGFGAVALINHLLTK